MKTLHLYLFTLLFLFSSTQVIAQEILEYSGGIALSAAESAAVSVLQLSPQSAATPLPDSIHNNWRIYFPPIYNQTGTACCTQASEIGHTFTYEMNRLRNVAQLPLNEETSAIYNLVQELRANYAAELTKLALAAWVDKLEADNKAYEELVKSSYEEDAAKTELKAKEARTAIDITVRKIFERIEALMLIEGEQNYTEFVRRLNLQIDKYDNTLAQRRGAAKAKRE